MEEEEENGMRRKKSRISRRNSLEGEGEGGGEGGERMVVGEEGVEEEWVEEKRDERHVSLREGEEGEGMMDLS